MTFYLLGTGRMAHFLATRLAGTAHRCKGVYGRNPESAKGLAQTLSAPVIERVEDFTGPVDACLLAVSDDAIAPLAQQLPAQEGTVIHFSGTVSIDALFPHPHRAVCWPVYSISEDIFPEISIPAGTEGSDKPAQETLTLLAEALTFRPFEAPEAARRQLHLAAVFGNNFTNHLLCICNEICLEAALPPEVIRPLLMQTFERAISGNPCEVQTGPARRGDLKTQQAHLALLAQHPQWQRVYEAISESITQQYRPQ